MIRTAVMTDSARPAVAESARQAVARTFVESLRGALAGEPCRLRRGQEPEVLKFLSARPQHTARMAALVVEHGLEGDGCRGTFYGCRDAAGRLEGVALVGHRTLFETRTAEALKRLAVHARRHAREVRSIQGERDAVAEFWRHYSAGSPVRRRAARALLFESRDARAGDVIEESPADAPGPRPATPDLLELVADAHAEVFRAEVSQTGGGVEPFGRDSEGFMRACLRRIEAGRTRVVVREGRLVFKAEVTVETPGAAYLEGVYVARDERESGLGAACLARLSADLLSRTRSVCLHADEEDFAAHVLYHRAGFRVGGRYASVFL